MRFLCCFDSNISNLFSFNSVVFSYGMLVVRLVFVGILTFPLYAVESFDNQDSDNAHMYNANTNRIHTGIYASGEDSRFLFGNVSLLSKDAPFVIDRISSNIFNESGVKIIIYMVDSYAMDSPLLAKEDLGFNARREYEDHFLKMIDGDYAVIFLFYNEHTITIRTNVGFLQTNELLEEFAYPYLPAESVGTDKYKNGVNEGLSNLYLALSHAVAKHYNIDLDAPEPLKKPSDMTKVVIYVMLVFLIILFVLVSNGFFRKDTR